MNTNKAIPPGRKAEFPDNLFKSWHDYRLSLGQTRADLIREVNQKLDRKFSNTRFYAWLKQTATVSEPLMLEFIYPELPQVIQYIFQNHGFPANGINFSVLADALKPPVKIPKN